MAEGVSVWAWNQGDDTFFPGVIRSSLFTEMNSNPVSGPPFLEEILMIKGSASF